MLKTTKKLAKESGIDEKFKYLLEFVTYDKHRKLCFVYIFMLKDFKNLPWSME